MMGRIQLVNSVIGGTVQYSFKIYKWPVNLIKERNIRNFIWTGSRDTRALVTTKWSKICKHKNEGGLINLKTQNQVVMMKLTYNQNMCTDLLRKIFLNKKGMFTFLHFFYLSMYSPLMMVINA